MDCILRGWEPTDAPAFAKALSNSNILNNLRDGLPYPYTEAGAAGFIAAMRAADPNETIAFAITVQGAVVGSIGIFRRGNIHRRTAEMGYYIAEECWGRGVATSAVQQACAFVFANTDILRIFAEPFADNSASCRVLKKAGFSFEGLLRKNAVVRDMKLYALVR